ncbi:uncharacterized protein G2W53_041275 [Senna tora]|uniref:Uncharacterized protein n=1 Tax=Senna tora TaxID=362788 RepID=A0A834SEX7_9FABA|nr:uncharacterized protein G2W53_041275 [Senna tora]
MATQIEKLPPFHNLIKEIKLHHNCVIFHESDVAEFVFAMAVGWCNSASRRGRATERSPRA